MHSYIHRYRNYCEGLEPRFEIILRGPYLTPVRLRKKLRKKEEEEEEDLKKTVAVALSLGR